MTEKVEWTDELKQQVISVYEESNPTPENTMEIVKKIAEDMEKSPNGIRVILSRAGVYVKKEAPKTTAKSGGTASPRVNKAAALERLTDAITAKGAEVNTDIISKLTGKAGVYFAEILEGIDG